MATFFKKVAGSDGCGLPKTGSYLLEVDLCSAVDDDKLI